MSQKPKGGSQARQAAMARSPMREANQAVAAPAIETAPETVEVAPVAIESVAIESAPIESAVTESAAIDPAGVAAVETIHVEPADADPVMSPIAIEPVAVVSIAIEPVAMDPASVVFDAAIDQDPVDAEPEIAPLEVAAETSAAAIPEAVSASMSATATLTPTTPLKGIHTMMKNTEDFVAFGQANLEAFVKSGQIWSAGMQELTKQFAATAKASFDESVSTFKTIGTVKSVKEAMELQTGFAKTAMEKAMAESNKLTDASMKLTEQALAPIAARVTVAIETFGKAA